MGLDIDSYVVLCKKGMILVDESISKKVMVVSCAITCWHDGGVTHRDI
jgi:hypothetical protein